MGWTGPIPRRGDLGPSPDLNAKRKARLANRINGR